MLGLEGADRDRFVRAVERLNELLRKLDKGHTVTALDLCGVIEILKGRK